MKKPTTKSLQDKLWKKCRELAFLMYKNDCYTCPARNLEGANCQLGHVPWPKAALSAHLKYDMRLLKWQCYSCNINKGGMGAEAYKRMLRENGKEYMESLERERQILVKADTIYYENKIKEIEEEIARFKK